MTEQPADRWKQLSAAVTGFHDRGWHSLRDASAFAMTLERELRQHIGSPARFRQLPGEHSARPTSFLSYTPGRVPDDDRFEPVEGLMDAIGVSRDGFSTFGLGVTLEMGDATTPRYSFHWLVRLDTHDPTRWICEIRIGETRRFELQVAPNGVDVSPVVDWIFRALLVRLEGINRPPAKALPIGFDLGC